MTVFKRRGTAFVICAPSGAGKTTLSKRLIANYERFAFSISCTTRAPRPHEINGKDYFFLEKPEFESLIQQNYFAEWAIVHGNYYGTPLDSTCELLDAGKDLLFDIDVQGAAQLKESLPAAFFVFILPPSKKELEKRLRNRGTDSDASINLRLANAAKELKEAHWFDAWIINDNLDQAFQDLCSAYRTACMSPANRPQFLTDLIRQFKI